MKRNTHISVLNRDGVRRRINLEVGATGPYVSGDLLDANATQELVNEHISNLVNLAPEALDTLGEVATVLNDKVDASSLATVATSGDYNDLQNKPNIPTNISTFSNDAGYITPPEVIGVQAFPSSWPKSGTLSQLIDAINTDSNAVAGKAYLATVTYSDLPAGLNQAEIKAEITNDDGPGGYVILFTVTSEDVAPYHWERTSAYGRSGEWRSWSVATSGDTLNAASFNIDNWSITYATREAPISEIIDINDASHDNSKIAVVNINQSDPSNISITGDNGTTDVDSVLRAIRDGSKVGILNYDDGLKISKFYPGDITPRNGIDVGVFMRLPKFYFRCVQNANEIVQIQFTMDSSLTDETWNIWNGNTFIGCYKVGGDLNSLHSGGGTPLTNKSLSEFKSSSRTLGNGFSIVAYEAHQIMALLFYCYYGSTDCQSLIGSGKNYSANYNASVPITYSNHVNSDTAADGSIAYWGLADWWGALNEWIDNIVTLGSGYVGIQNYDGSIRRVVKTGTSSGIISNMVFGQYVDILPNDTGLSSCGGCGGCGCGSNYGWNDYGVVSGSAGYVAMRSYSDGGPLAGVGCLNVDVSPSYAYSRYGSRLLYTGPYIEIESN